MSSIFKTKKIYFIYSVVALGLLLVAILIYPTLYRYDTYDKRLPVRIHRITGKAEVLMMDGWRVMEGSELETQAPEDELEVDQEGYTFEEYFEKIKENTDPERLDRRHEYYTWERKRLGLIEYSLYPNDDGRRFSKNATMSEVEDVMGLPKSISKYEELNEEVWFYNGDSITFKDGKIHSWNNEFGGLKIE